MYSSGFGAVMPLQLVAARCRDPAIRQEALDLLQRARRREWVWDSNLVKDVVSGTVAFERAAAAAAAPLRNNREAQSTFRQVTQRVPDDARVREVKVVFEGDRKAKLVYTTVGQWKNKEPGYQRSIQW